MYGIAAGVTQPVRPWSTATGPIRVATPSAAERRAELRIPIAIRVPFMLWRVRLPAPAIPVSIRASSSAKTASSSSGSWSARCPYRSQPAWAVQSRVEDDQRSARARTPGTLLASEATKTSTRT